MKAFYQEFHTIEELPVRDVGGKAKTLAELTRAGFSVPRGIVLTVAFFEAWQKTVMESEFWQLLKADPTEECRRRLQDWISDFAFSARQEAALDEALKSMAGISLFAVRSSSPEEDQVESSFAGMYASFLEVDREALQDRIRNVFASLFNDRVLVYKHEKGMGLNDASLAVIIQQQINSEISGVGFSLNPRNNCYDEAVINAGFGLGEAIVNGQVTPDSYVVDKVNGQILHRKTREAKAVLSDGQISQVVELIGDCEAHYGYPVDIEWAYEAGRLYLLQVRPITTYIPLFPEMMTAPGERKKLYMDAIVVAQGFSDPLSVLGLDLWEKAMDMIGGQGIMPAGEGGYFINLHGRQYFQVSNLLKGMGNRLGIAMVGNHDPAIKEVQETIIAEYKAIKKTTLMRQAKRAMGRVAVTTIPMMMRMLVNPKAQEERYNQLLEEFLGKVKKLDDSSRFCECALAGFQNLKPIMTHSVTYAPGELAFSRLKRMFRKEAVEKELSAVQSMVPSNPTVAMGKSQLALASSSEICGELHAESFLRKLQEGGFDKVFERRFDAYLNRYGYRGFKEIDVATPRVRNYPEVLFQQLKEIRLEENQMELAEAKKTEAVEKLRALAAKKGRERKFDRLLETYERLFGFREAPKDMVAFLLGRLHELAIEAGEAFVKEGRLDAASEIFDLHLDQIAYGQADKQVDLATMREENLAPYREVAHVKRWPTNIDSRGKIRYPKPKPVDGGWQGTAIAAGVVQGRAKVLKAPYEKPIEPGDILVTVSTEPAWTPIFLNAAGVVLEIGGILQHGAVIAREYGIPCVSEIRNATTVIQDGDLIEVDGTQGVVHILQEKE